MPGNFLLHCYRGKKKSKLIAIYEYTYSLFQMRLDFNTFVITGPSTYTDTETKILNGQVNVANGKEAGYATTCATDIFSITNAPNLPTLCGTLTGEHGIMSILNV